MEWGRPGRIGGQSRTKKFEGAECLTRQGKNKRQGTDVVLFDQQSPGSVFICETVLFRNHKTKHPEARQCILTAEPLIHIGHGAEEQ